MRRVFMAASYSGGYKNYQPKYRQAAASLCVVSVDYVLKMNLFIE